jgi:membrane protease YdiL (CAAX protease family)
MLSSNVMHGDFALILFFLGVVVPWLGRRRVRQLLELPQTTKMDRLTLYASTIAFQWLAAAIIVWRANARGIHAAQLGLAIPNLGLTIAASIFLAGLILVSQLVSLRRLAMHPEEIGGILPQLALKVFPQDAIERLVFFALVSTVAVCEELIYRGFVQFVFQSWFRGLILAGILGSAALFALAHLYQGRSGLVSTFVLGTLFSAIRVWTGSILAPTVAHFVADLSAGFLAPSRLRAALAEAARDESRAVTSSSALMLLL